MDTRERPQEQASQRAIAPDTGSPELLEAISKTTEETAQGKQKIKPPSTPLQESLRRLRKDTRAMVSIGVVLLFVVIALVGPAIYQRIGGIYNSPTTGKIGPERYHSFDHQELSRQDEGPSAQYSLGTDALGRDLLARLMQGMLISLAVAFVVEMVDIVFGVLIGVLAGYYGGVDRPIAGTLYGYYVCLPRGALRDTAYRYLWHMGR